MGKPGPTSETRAGEIAGVAQRVTQPAVPRPTLPPAEGIAREQRPEQHTEPRTADVGADAHRLQRAHRARLQMPSVAVSGHRRQGPTGVFDGGSEPNPAAPDGNTPRISFLSIAAERGTRRGLLRVILRSSQQVTDTGLQTRIPAVGADLRLQRARLGRVRGLALNVCCLDGCEQPRPRDADRATAAPRDIPGWPRYHTCMGALQGYHRDRQKSAPTPTVPSLKKARSSQTSTESTA